METYFSSQYDSDSEENIAIGGVPMSVNIPPMLAEYTTKTIGSDHTAAAILPCRSYLGTALSLLSVRELSNVR